MYLTLYKLRHITKFDKLVKHFTSLINLNNYLPIIDTVSRDNLFDFTFPYCHLILFSFAILPAPSTSEWLNSQQGGRKYVGFVVRGVQNAILYHSGTCVNCSREY